MWQVTEPFKSIVKNRTEFFSLFVFFFPLLQSRWGERKRGSFSLARQNFEHQTTAGVKHTSGQRQWYSVPTPEEEHRTTSMQYPTRAYWYCLDNPDLDLCKAALPALPGTPTVSPAKQYHLQKQHVLIRADSTFCDEVIYP